MILTRCIGGRGTGATARRSRIRLMDIALLAGEVCLEL
jgi:hypothetical protein